MLRHALIRAALDGLALSGAPRWLPAVPDAAGLVVTLHHVLPARHSTFAPNALLAIEPHFLDRFLGDFIAKGWRFVTVDEIVKPGNGHADWRRIAVTLDDGYRNNFEHALPVFRRHRVPFAIYVCPGFCDRTAAVWWEALERIVAGAERIAAPGDDATRTLSTKSVPEKERAFRAWRAWLTTDADETLQRVAIRKLADDNGIDLSSLARHLVMDWSEVAAIAADPLCSIGAHTMTHPALARLPREIALREIRDSIERIEAKIGKRPTSLAFPYGHAAAAGVREAELAAEAGLVASFTTRPGYIPIAGSRHGLPRVSINGLFQRLRYLDVLLTPGFWSLRKRAGRAA